MRFLLGEQMIDLILPIVKKVERNAVSLLLMLLQCQESI
jgi:hypothetical protein